jgi:gliding motility-associated-like protein
MTAAIHIRMRSIFIVVFFLGAVNAYAQKPVITSVDLLATYPLARVLVTGSGFDSNTANLVVWFDQVKGTVVRASVFSVEVTVPPQARLHNIEVIHLVSRLSAKSPLKFMPVYSGEGFNPTKLTAPLIFTSFNAVFDVCSCDLNNDNKPELIGTKYENTATDIIVLQNQSTPGNIAFTKLDKTNLPVLGINAPTGQVTCGDLNGDGKPDLVTSRSGTTANSIFVLRNTGTPGIDFAAPLELLLDAGHFARQVSINDLNGDGKPEIIVANSFNNVLYIFLNQSSNGTLSISPSPLKITLDGAPNSLALEVQDFDGDQKSDIAFTQNQSANLYIMKNQSSGTISFAKPTVIALAGTFNDLNSADFNKDGKLDLAITSPFNNQVVVLINQSNNTNYSFGTPIILSTSNGPFGMDVSDMDGDGFPDIIVGARTVAAIDVFLHDRNASPGFNKVVVTTSKPNWFVRAGDLDGDAKPDIAFTSFNAVSSSYSIEILRNRNCHLPKILNEAPLSICPGQTIRLNAIPAPNVTFEWKNGATSIKNSSDAFVDITAAGTYTVTATGESGLCSVVSASFIVSSGTGSAPATPAINPITPVCIGSTLNITTAAVAGATYQWEGPAGLDVSEADPTLSIPNITATQAGLYTLRVKVGDCTSDSDTEEAQLIDMGAFSISSNMANPLCEGQSATLAVNSAPSHTYQWRKDGADIAGQTGNTLSVNQEGLYTVNVTYTGCSKETAGYQIIILTKPVAKFNTSASSACIGSLISFTNTSTVDSRATAIYAWDFGDGQTASSADATHTYASVGTFSTTLAVSYSGLASCTGNVSTSISIADASPPEIISEKTEICPGQETMLSIAGTYSTITWNTGETAAFIIVSLPGPYTVTTEDSNGCVGNDDIAIAESAGCGTIELNIPNMFSPNGDTRNDRWVISGAEDYPECTMKIYDDKGVRIFQQTGYPAEGWDGVYNGKSLPDGVYYYVFSCPEGKPKTGSVTIFR